MIFKSPLCIYDSADYQGDSCTNRRSRNVPGTGRCTDLVQKEAAGEDAKMSLILAHAEDQMMSTEVFKVLAEEMIELYKKVNK